MLATFRQSSLSDRKRVIGMSKVLADELSCRDALESIKRVFTISI